MARKGLSRREFVKASVMGGTAFVLGGTFLAACTTTGQTPTAPASGGTTGTGASVTEVVIAWVGPLTGRAAPWGTKNLDGVKFIVGEINGGGGIKKLNGAKLRIDIYDNQSNVDINSSQMEKAIATNPLCIVGNVDSASTMAGTVISEKYKIPHISAQSIADKISERGLKYAFQRSIKSGQTAQLVVDYVAAMGIATGKAVKRVSILVENKDAGVGAGNLYRERLKKYPQIQLVDFITYPSDQDDFTAIVSKIKASGVDMVFQMGYVQDAVNLVQTMKTLDYNPFTIIHSTGGGSEPDFFKTLGKDAEYVTTVDTFPPAMLELAEVKPLNDKFKARTNYDIEHSSSQSISTIGMITHILEETGSTNRETFYAALKKVDIPFGASYVISPDGIKWDENNHNMRATGIVVQNLKGQRGVPVWPERYAKSKPVWPVPAWKERG